MANENLSGLTIPLVLSPEAKELLLLLRKQQGSANVQLEVGEQEKNDSKEDDAPRSRRGSGRASRNAEPKEEQEEQPRSRRGSSRSSAPKEEEEEQPRSRRSASKEKASPKGPVEAIAERAAEFIAANPEKNAARLQTLMNDYGIKKVFDLEKEKDIEDFDADLADYEKRYL